MDQGRSRKTGIGLFVPDASVILKWVLPSRDEGEVEQALRLRDQAVAGEVELLVPPLWQYEVGNTLARRFPEQAQALIDALIRFGMHECPPTQSWRERALDLVRAFGVTFYDASYHALALEQGARFVTADERYIRRAGHAGEVIHPAEL